ncbi:MAG: tRNA 2-thiouridine(34) synthase MnmA [Clostridiaceae bacterium]|jgi:tRNA-specific 2-thiouridylase|nr:tRNA 2-thiouridine(34) synthase MnmA [Clostridiaceae bacterium]
MPADPAHQADRHVIVGMSGGVDSSVASLLLREQGYSVSGVFLLTDDSSAQALADSRAVCRQLEIPLKEIDIRTRFRTWVVDTFVDAWLAGLTPNPCVLCNPTVKFSLLREAADQLGARWIATGHYASVRQTPENRLGLVQTGAGQKDQTYFLYRLGQDLLARLLLPLADWQKEAVRAKAGAAGLTDAGGHNLGQKADSQDICFIPDGDYPGLVRREAERRGLATSSWFEPGPVVDLAGKTIGQHKGLLHYTVGQRKGFEVRTTERLFVLARRPASNTLVVGPYSHLYHKQIRLTDVVWSGAKSLKAGQPVLARVRSSAVKAPAQVWPQPDKSLRVVFEQPVAAPTPGQSGVLYEDRLILAGGIIADDMSD